MNTSDAAPVSGGPRPVSSMVRPHLKDLVPYVPILPTDVLSREGGIAPEAIIKLDGNENPYGPSPKVRAALERFDAYHIYPDPNQGTLRSKLAEYVGVSPASIITGNGSDEIIDLLVRMFLEPGDTVVNCGPTFGMYPFVTQVCGAALAEVARRPDFSLDVDAVLSVLARPASKLIFLASPNNPTGNPLAPRELHAVLATGAIVVVDEAYQEFSSAPSYAGEVAQHENLVVLRTFSKWAGLAGLRVGYGIMAPQLAHLMDQIKPPYNVNVAGLVAAEASLDDRGYILGRVGRIIEERAHLFARLRVAGFLEPIASEANFILCRVRGKDAGDVKQKLERQGIFIKHIDTPLLPNALRFSVGKPEHTAAIAAALGSV
ncbi:MAG: histidinol-phosphate transaminase [Dehalococcoidia bacterium]|nr:histidinol-phosphate transaminase [Dehalococcoidia bacterium]